MSRRSKGREVALQMLYQADLNPEVTAASVHEQMSDHLKDKSLTMFAWNLYTRVLEVRPELDRRIRAVADNWALTRMAPTDRNVLRLGAWELLYSDTPPRVVIDEAIELARKFGAAQSTQFVNGILDRLIPAEKRRPAERKASEGATPTTESTATQAPTSAPGEPSGTGTQTSPQDAFPIAKDDDGPPTAFSNGTF